MGSDFAGKESLAPGFYKPGVPAVREGEEFPLDAGIGYDSRPSPSPDGCGAERLWSFGGPSTAKLEWTAAMVMMVITALAVITGIPRFDRSEQGRTKERSCPKKPTPNGPHSGEGKSQGPRVLE